MAAFETDLIMEGTSRPGPNSDLYYLTPDLRQKYKLDENPKTFNKSADLVSARIDWVCIHILPLLTVSLWWPKLSRHIPRATSPLTFNHTIADTISGAQSRRLRSENRSTPQERWSQDDSAKQMAYKARLSSLLEHQRLLG